MTSTNPLYASVPQHTEMYLAPPMCEFFGIPPGSTRTRAQVVAALREYIAANGLKTPDTDGLSVDGPLSRLTHLPFGLQMMFHELESALLFRMSHYPYDGEQSKQLAQNPPEGEVTQQGPPPPVAGPPAAESTPPKAKPRVRVYHMDTADMATVMRAYGETGMADRLDEAASNHVSRGAGESCPPVDEGPSTAAILRAAGEFELAAALEAGDSPPDAAVPMPAPMPSPMPVPTLEPAPVPTQVQYGLSSESPEVNREAGEPCPPDEDPQWGEFQRARAESVCIERESDSEPNADCDPFSMPRRAGGGKGEPGFPLEKPRYMPPALCEFMGAPFDSTATVGDVVARTVSYAAKRDLYLECGNIDRALSIAFNCPEDTGGEPFLPEVRANLVMREEPFFPSQERAFSKRLWRALDACRGIGADYEHRIVNEYMMDAVHHFSLEAIETRGLSAVVLSAPVALERSWLQSADDFRRLMDAVYASMANFHPNYAFSTEDIVRARWFRDRVREYADSEEICAFYEDSPAKMRFGLSDESRGLVPPHLYLDSELALMLGARARYYDRDVDEAGVPIAEVRYVDRGTCRPPCPLAKTTYV